MSRGAARRGSRAFRTTGPTVRCKRQRWPERLEKHAPEQAVAVAHCIGGIKTHGTQLRVEIHLVFLRVRRRLQLSATPLALAPTYLAAATPRRTLSRLPGRRMRRGCLVLPLGHRRVEKRWRDQLRGGGAQYSPSFFTPPAVRQERPCRACFGARYVVLAARSARACTAVDLLSRAMDLCYRPDVPGDAAPPNPLPLRGGGAVCISRD